MAKSRIGSKKANFRNKSARASRLTQLIVILAVIALIAYADYHFMFRHHTFEIEDKCGMIAGSVMHILDTEAACEIRCKSQCSAQEMSYEKSAYTGLEQGCNICKCTCRRFE